MQLLPLTIKTILGQEIYVVADPSSLVKDLKSQIEKCDGIQSNMQMLLFDGKELANERTLSHYKLYDNCTLQIAGKHLGGAANMNVFLKTMSGKTTQIEVNQEDTVEMVKRKVEELQGVQTEYQQLIYGGKQLHNNFKLKDYKISQDSVIFLVLRLRGGSILVTQVDTSNDKRPGSDTIKLHNNSRVYPNHVHIKANATCLSQ
jgi:hypothetical protein